MSYPGYPPGYNQPNGAPTPPTSYATQRPVLPVNGHPPQYHNGHPPGLNGSSGYPPGPAQPAGPYKMAPGPPPTTMGQIPTGNSAPSMPMNYGQQVPGGGARPPPMQRMPSQPPQQPTYPSRVSQPPGMPPHSNSTYPNQISPNMGNAMGAAPPMGTAQMPPMSMGNAPVPGMPQMAPGNHMGMAPPPTSMGPPPTSMGPGGYPHQPQGQYPAQGMTNQFGNMNMNNQNQSVNQPISLMQTKDAPVGPRKYQPSKVKYQLNAPPGISRIPPNRSNCDRDVMCSTLNAIPSSDSLCQKSKLPFGLLLHPYKARVQHYSQFSHRSFF